MLSITRKAGSTSEAKRRTTMDVEVQDTQTVPDAPSAPVRVWSWAGMRLWAPLGMLTAVLMAIWAPVGAYAAVLPHHLYLAAGGIPPVQYGTGNTALTTPVVGAMQNIAQTIRLVLGGTALVVILAAAVMNHFVHDQQAKQRAKELIGAAVVGLLLAAFAPAIVNFIASL